MGERLRRRLVEASMLRDQDSELVAGLRRELVDTMAQGERRLEEQRYVLGEEHREATQAEAPTAQERIDEFEAMARRHEQELESLSAVRAAVETLESCGGLSSLGKSIAALRETNT